MLFSSAIFLFTFLPAVILLYYLIPRTWQNTFLFIASLVFFAWGGVSYSLLLIISIILNYFSGILIGKYEGTARARFFFISGITLNLLMLVIFKYANFITGSLNALFYITGIPEMPLLRILLPIGISFYTFQAMSYLVDIYRKETQVQQNILHLGLYISLFPQLIAGPIVRYHDIANQLTNRKTDLKKFSYGIRRFIIGLSKKVLIANSFAVIADDFFTKNPLELSPAIAWTGIIAYTFQIYFDFSGYSDMAIGLGSMFGFRIPENFNFPYIARSIREFWRRWHISLSTWFRDYLYIPLGGNRVTEGRTYFNLLIVFFLTGLWHGAEWKFVAWGLLHGFFMVLERLGWENFLRKLWKPVQHLYALFVVVMAWVLFRADSFGDAWNYYRAMFGSTHPQYGLFELSRYLNPEMLTITGIAILASFNSFGIADKGLKRIYEQLPGKIKMPFSIINSLAVVVFFSGLLALCAVYLLAETYNPFIYFRF